MTGYEIESAWFDFSDENPSQITPLLSALMFAVLHRANECRWKTEFSLPTAETMQRVGVNSKTTYFAAFHLLEKWGFIEATQTAKNQKKDTFIRFGNRFSAVSNNDTADVQQTYSRRTADVQQEPPAVSKNDTALIGIENSSDKQVKQQPGEAPAPPVSAGDFQEGRLSIQEKTPGAKRGSKVAAPVNVPFDEFWNTYGKKEDRALCEKKWSTLTNAERLAIMEHLPHYVRATPTPKYRKNPSTYLNQKKWLDGIPQPETAPAPIDINQYYVEKTGNRFFFI